MHNKKLLLLLSSSVWAVCGTYVQEKEVLMLLCSEGDALGALRRALADDGAKTLACTTPRHWMSFLHLILIKNECKACILLVVAVLNVGVLPQVASYSSTIWWLRLARDAHSPHHSFTFLHSQIHLFSSTCWCLCSCKYNHNTVLLFQ